MCDTDVHWWSWCEYTVEQVRGIARRCSDYRCQAQALKVRNRDTIVATRFANSNWAANIHAGAGEVVISAPGGPPQGARTGRESSRAMFLGN